MRIFLLVSNDYLYQPYIYEKVVVARKNEIVGIGLVPFLPPNMRKVDFYRFILDLYGLKGVITKSGQLYFYRTLGLLERVFAFTRSYSVTAIANKYNIPLWHIRDVNDIKTIELLRDLQPDVVISGQGQLIKKEVLDIPRIGIINKHAGMLPKYRGVYPIFWAMLNNENEIGVTVHFMNENFDDGEIIVQKRLAVMKDDTFESLYRKVIEVTPGVILEAIDRIEENRTSGMMNDSAEATYYSYPQKEDIVKLRKLGRRII